MTDSLQAAASLADKIGGNLDAFLPETAPVIDCDALAGDRMELRQVAGISAGGCLELRAGSYDFGPVRSGTGRLNDGDPDTVGFTLSLDDTMAATIGPGDSPIMLDDQIVLGETEVAGRVINAGSARFVVARPRPPRKRGGQLREVDPTQLDPWVATPLPVPGSLGVDGSRMIDQRRRLHYGPDEIRHRIEVGTSLLWDRQPSHPLFGTAVVAMADVSVSAAGQKLHRSGASDLTVRAPGIELAAAVPVSIDVLGSDTMIFGERRLQLAVARHILLALAAATHPKDLELGLLSDRADLNFLRRLPHAAGVTVDRVEVDRIEVDRVEVGSVKRRLIIVDGPESAGLRFGPADGMTSVLVLARERDEPRPDSDVLAVHNEASIAIAGGNGGSSIDDATPVGFAQSMAVELVEKLHALRDLDPIDG